MTLLVLQVSLHPTCDLQLLWPDNIVIIIDWKSRDILIWFLPASLAYSRWACAYENWKPQGERHQSSSHVINCHPHDFPMTFPSFTSLICSNKARASPPAEKLKFRPWWYMVLPTLSFKVSLSHCNQVTVVRLKFQEHCHIFHGRPKVWELKFCRPHWWTCYSNGEKCRRISQELLCYKACNQKMPCTKRNLLNISDADRPRTAKKCLDLFWFFCQYTITNFFSLVRLRELQETLERTHDMHITSCSPHSHCCTFKSTTLQGLWYDCMLMYPHWNLLKTKINVLKGVLTLLNAARGRLPGSVDKCSAAFASPTFHPMTKIAYRSPQKYLKIWSLPWQILTIVIHSHASGTLQVPEQNLNCFVNRHFLGKYYEELIETTGARIDSSPLNLSPVLYHVTHVNELHRNWVEWRPALNNVAAMAFKSSLWVTNSAVEVDSKLGPLRRPGIYLVHQSHWAHTNKIKRVIINAVLSFLLNNFTFSTAFSIISLVIFFSQVWLENTALTNTSCCQTLQSELLSPVWCRKNWEEPCKSAWPFTKIEKMARRRRKKCHTMYNKMI